jgi:nucleoside-diphosphate-sugar epimerase
MNARRGIVIITGGGGLIGTATAARLAASFDVVSFDVGPPSHTPPGVDGVIVDITSDDSVSSGLGAVRERHGGRIASVIHLAAYYDFSGEPSPKYDEITVRGTERLLRALEEFPVEQLVFSSSTLVHAPCELGGRINEDWPLEPKWDYPQSKVRAEELIRTRRGAIPAAILRIAGVYDDRCRSIPIAHQIQRIYERRLTGRVFPGDISHGQPFVHLDDLVDALARAVERRAQLPEELTLLIGEPETLSYDELQREIGRLIHGEEWETQQIPKAVAKAGAWVQDALPLGEEPFIKPWMIDLADDHMELDINRARTHLGWEPERSLRATLPKMVAALKADPVGWYRENKLEVPSWLEEGASEPSKGPSAGAGAR